MTNKQFLKKLKRIEACPEAIKFVQDNNYTMQEAWNNCVRADWLFWLSCKTEMSTKRLRIHAICDCAETALKYVPKGEDRPKKAIYWARIYAESQTAFNLEKLNAARAAAGNAAWSIAWDTAHKKMCNLIRERIKI